MGAGGGVYRISARGCLRSGPIRKVGGGGQSTSGPIYEKWGRGGGPVRFRSDALFGTQKKYVIVNNTRLQF